MSFYVFVDRKPAAPPLFWNRENPISPSPNVSADQTHPVWTSPNVSFPNDARNPQYAMNGLPTIPYTPRHPLPTGPLFGRLAYRLKALPIIEEDGKWFLSEHLRDQWHELEYALLRMCQVLYSALRMERVMFGLEAEAFRQPSAWGYRDTFKNMQDARYSCWRSLQAFYVLSGTCSMHIAIHQHKKPSSSEDHPVWASLLQLAGFPPAWIDDLRRSFVADFSIERAGVYIDATEETPLGWQSQLPVLLSANVPIWFNWAGGNIAPTLSDSVALSCRPTSRQVAAALDAPLRIGSPRSVISPPAGVILAWSPLIASTSPVLGPSSTLPPTSSSAPALGPFLNREGETMEEYFARIAILNKQMEDAESAQERAVRLNRAANAQRAGGPGRKSAVFLWDDLDGWLVRIRLNHSEVDGWYGNAGTRATYNAFFNEWDICPDENSNLDEEDEDDVFAGMTLVSDAAVALDRDVDISKAQWDSTLANAYNPGSQSDNSVTSPDFNIILRQRYGVYTPPQGPALALLGSEKYTRSLISRIFVVKESDVPQDLQSHIANLLLRMLANTENPDVPPQLWDISPQSPRPLTTQRNPHLTITKQVANSRNCYFVRVTGRDDAVNEGWVLVVHDAATAVECLRMPHTDTREIARELAARGTPFSTFRRVTEDSYALHSPPRVYLGWREKGWKATPADYRQYEECRNDFFRQERVRAALLKGGIVWRLAVESLGGTSLAMIGPSGDVARYGQILRPSSGNELYVDDDLSENETDMICGVYHVYSQDTGRQIELRCGLNVGYWSQQCEDWFQKRLALIRSGERPPLGSIRWRDAVRFYKPTPKLIQANENAAAQFLGREAAAA
ncbi:hypothetical protein B0H21DRAFT_767080 [Amylocystis lapponica]|nr:hypothetical protein B0H21DRAFT_767080 [Amylocystis lapponica]